MSEYIIYLFSKEEYMRKKHLEILSLNSLYDCDKSLILKSKTNDDRDIYIQIHNYEKSFVNQLYRKLYIMMINDKELKKEILKIKYHDIKLDIHKKLEIYPIIQSLAKNIIKETDKDVLLWMSIIRRRQNIILYRITR